MKILALTSFLVFTFFPLRSQSIVGTWQLVEQTTCLDDELEPADADTEDLTNDMKSMSGGTNREITFKDNQKGEENVRIMDSRKTDKMSDFLYKVNDNNLYILDKKSRLLVASFEIEKLSADSLVISNIKRECETRVFVRVRDSK